MRCSRGAHEALTCVIVEGEEVVEKPVDGGNSESKLEEDVRAPPRGTDARPCSREASTTAHPCMEACAVDPFHNLRIGRHKSCVSVQPEPPRAGVSAGEAWMWRRVNLRGQKSRPGAHAWRGTAWGAYARKGRGDGEQGGWGSGAGAGKVGEMMDDGWVRSRAQGGRVRAHLPGEGPPSSPPANVVLGAVGEGLRPPQIRMLARRGRVRSASTWRRAAHIMLAADRR